MPSSSFLVTKEVTAQIKVRRRGRLRDSQRDAGATFLRSVPAGTLFASFFDVVFLQEHFSISELRISQFEIYVLIYHFVSTTAIISLKYRKK